MKDEELLKILESERYAQHLGDFDGSCPCGGASIKLPAGTVNFHARCWRVSENAQDLYVWGNHPKIEYWAEKIKENLDKQEWYNPYTIIYSKF